jgi:hypothetical protein
LRFKICIPAFCTIARISLFSGQCERLSRRLVLLIELHCANIYIQQAFAPKSHVFPNCSRTRLYCAVFHAFSNDACTVNWGTSSPTSKRQGFSKVLIAFVHRITLRKHLAIFSKHLRKICFLNCSQTRL